MLVVGTSGRSGEVISLFQYNLTTIPKMNCPYFKTLKKI